MQPHQKRFRCLEDEWPLLGFDIKEEFKPSLQSFHAMMAIDDPDRQQEHPAYGYDLEDCADVPHISPVGVTLLLFDALQKKKVKGILKH